MEINGLEKGTEPWFLLKALNELSDDFAAWASDRVEGVTSTILGEFPARTADVDTMWWLTAIKIALEQVRGRFVLTLEAREQEYADYGLDKAVPKGTVLSLVDASMFEAAAGMAVRTQESILSGLRGEDLVEAIRDTVTKELKKFIESLDVAFSVHDRVALRELGSERNADLWLYSGPVDSRNRPFCADIVRRKTLFTAKGIDALNDHPLLHSYVPPNVSVLCGGYGCRHVWLPVQRDSDIAKDMEVDDG